MKVIFLDVDGVLNSEPYFDTIPRELKNVFCENEICKIYVQQLKRIIDKTNAKIVLCSTWRVGKKNNHPLYLYLVEKLAEFNMEIYDITEKIDCDRPFEIKKYLNKHNDIENFVIVEDDFKKEEYEKYNIEKYLFHTNFYGKSIEKTGLNETLANKIIDFLK